MASEIEKLLEKYWACETSLEEEAKLKEFFQGADIPPEWKDVTALFQYFDSQKNRTLDDRGFNSSLRSKLAVNGKNGKGKVVNMAFRYSKIAAGLVVLVAASFLVRQEIRKSYPVEVADTYTDPELAFMETKKALMMISKSFGKAQHEAGKIRVFNEAEEVVQKPNDKINKDL